MPTPGRKNASPSRAVERDNRALARGDARPTLQFHVSSRHDPGVIARERPSGLLWAGVVGPVLFVATFLVAGATRPGYDPLRHQVSLLSLGDGGAILVLSLLATGALLLVFATTLRAMLRGGPGARGGPLAIAVSGFGFLVAGMFSTQPLFGYPPGTPDGMATDITATSMLHAGGALLLFFGLVAAALVFARRFRQQGAGAWAVASLAVGIVVFVFFGASGGGPSGQLLFPAVAGLLQRVALVAGLGWVVAVALRAIRSGSI
jgi:hypothetical membrane protein